MNKTVTFNLNNHEWYIKGNKVLNLLDTTADRVILDKDAVDIILSRGFNLEIHMHRVDAGIRITSEELSTVNKYKDMVKIDIENNEKLYVITASTYLHTITEIRCNSKVFIDEMLKYDRYRVENTIPSSIVEQLSDVDIARIISIIYYRDILESAFTAICKVKGKIHWFRSIKEMHEFIVTN